MTRPSGDGSDRGDAEKGGAEKPGEGERCAICTAALCGGGTRRPMGKDILNVMYNTGQLPACFLYVRHAMPCMSCLRSANEQTSNLQRAKATNTPHEIIQGSLAFWERSMRHTDVPGQSIEVIIRERLEGPRRTR